MLARRGTSVLDRPPTRRRGRPVVLATLDVPYEEEAWAFAVDTAVESGDPLIFVNVVEVLPLPSTILGYGDVDPPPEDAEAMKAPALLAQSLGVRVERLRVRSPHPIEALLEIAAERGAGMLVFGPDRQRIGRRLYRKAAKAIRERAACLVWLA